MYRPYEMNERDGIIAQVSLCEYQLNDLVASKRLLPYSML